MPNINDEISYLKEKLSLKNGDIIYVVSHKKKKSALAGLLDFVTGGTVDLINSYQGGGYRFLVATSENGLIYQITNDKQIKQIAEIANWTLQKKENFTTETINDIQYKKIRKVMVD